MRMKRNYSLHYNFEIWNDRIKTYLNNVLNKSNDYFAKQCANGEIGNIKHEYISMLEYISDIEKYLFFNKNNPNFYNILKSIENINVISVLPPNRRGINVQSIPQQNIVLVNPDLRGNSSLTSRERTMMYVAHELGHYVNNEWMKSVDSFIDRQVRYGQMVQSEAELFQEGFSLLDEAITQNRAEDMAYAFARKRRPDVRSCIRDCLFNGDSYRTNYDSYGELQEPAIMFGRTLRGIGKIRSDEDALTELCNRATSPNFAKNIIEEYARDGQMINLIPFVEHMGVIKRASYSVFSGDNDVWALNKSKWALNKFKAYALQLRDCREPLDDSSYFNR